MRGWLQWLVLAIAGLALGLALAALQNTLGIPKPVMQIALFTIVAAALVAALWLGWRYYRDMAKDDWE